MKIVITDANTLTKGDLTFDVLKQYGELAIYETTASEQLAERVREADVILTNKCILGEETLKQAKSLKYIGLFATGYNNIDIAYTRKAGITVCNAGSYSTDAVAQQVFGFLLNHYTKIPEYDAFVKQGGWKKSPTFCPLTYETDEVAEKTLGIVGFGAIGQKVAAIARAFGMRVIVFTRTPRQVAGISFVNFETLLCESDVITVHCPLTPETSGIFDLAAFSKCKRSAYFINTARGGIVVEPDLRQALLNGLIAGAAIDVLEAEPMREDCVLEHVPNLTITPHVAWAPLSTRKRLLQIVADNLGAFLAGKPQNVVGRD